MRNISLLLSCLFFSIFSLAQGPVKLQPSENAYPKIATEKYNKLKVFDPQPLSTYQITKGADTTKKTPTTNDRKLPLDSKGNLLSVDGYKVTFNQPSDTGISNVCYTPRPYITGGPKDASCSYVVPCDNPANRDASSYTTTKYFQVVWHVMWDGGASSNINQAQIDALMAELNADYAAYNMIFCANPANFYEDATNYYHDENTEEVSLKNTYVTNPTQLINIYVVGDMGPGGYARFPYDPMGGTSNTGGIVLNRVNCNLGTHTLAHEMGHTFGLEHTFAGVDERAQCSSCYEKVRNVNGSSNTTGVPTPLGGPYTSEGDREGDWCSDTNPHDTYAYNCSTSSNANGACDAAPWANAPVNNHMSYSFCSTTFTDQQNRRMHCMVDSYLGSWTAYGGGICGAQPPNADFIGTPTTWQAPSNVTFTDLSAPSAIITSYTWTFDAAASGTVTCAGCTGANAQFVGQNPPVVTYPNPGLYTVSLTVTSANGNDTETKTNYIEVLAPTGDCDTLTTQWETPTPTIITYGFGGGWITGVQDPVNSVLPTDPKGVYEGYFSPNPGTTPVGAIRVGLGSLNDLDDDMTFQVVVYDDDGFGAPGALLGGSGGISPTQLGVPGVGFYGEYWIPILNAPIPTTAYFHVGVEIFPGDATDTLVVMTSCLGAPGCAAPQGENDASNHIWTTGFGYENLQTVYGADFDVDIIPMLGEYDARPVITGFTENVVCDTTYVEIFDTVLYTSQSRITGMTFTFADGTVINASSDPGSVTRVYTQPGPDTLTIAAINDCGRGDTLTVIIPYNFMDTPDADFTKNPANPICAGDPITFTANTPGYSDYTWDFGDGTVLSGTSSEMHTYVTPGLYYTNLTVTAPGYQPSDTSFLENFETGIPGTWSTIDNNSSAGNAAVNPPFDGTNATAWLPLDVNGTGDNEAYSNSWNNPSTQAADDWLISPAFPVGATNSLAWDAQAIDATFNDGYEVYVTAGAQNVAGCLAGTMVFSTTGENAFQTNRVVDLSAYGFTSGTARVCFRNNSTDKYLLAIDNVRVGTTGAGCTSSENKLDYVEIIDCSTNPPTANGTADVVNGCAPQTVNFTGGQTAGDPATSWTWNFGDGTFSTLQNPSHVYNSPGTYLVIFEACNTGGCDQNSFTIVISASESAAFSYSSTTECQSGTDMTATVTGTTGGTFTSNPAAGIVLNASTGTIDVSASTAGTYDITYVTSAGTCADSQTIQVTINPDENASFSYSAAAYCQNAADPVPTITGTGGGVFTSSPAGLSINSATGTIDVSASTPGTYTVTYTTGGPCSASSNTSITINTVDNASFSYAAAAYCVNASDPSPTITGTPGGTFTSSPVGLSINSSTGTIDVSASTPGTYTITYTTSGSCPASSNQSVTINALDNAGFSYSAASYCQVGADPTPTITGLGGGNFTSSPAGLSINASSGTIDLSASTTGTYTITYTTSGTCPNSSNVSVTITATDDPSFSYGSASYCNNGTDPTPTITGTSGGTFTSSPAGLSINSSTGTIDVSASANGTYTVTYTTGGTCSATSNQNVTINPADDPSFTYTGNTFCQSDTDPNPTITGLPGGTFTSSPAGLSINSGSGIIDLSTSSGGVYTITYTTSGSCPASTTFSMTIQSSPLYTVVISDENCGAGDGSITLTASGGDGGPYLYSIDGGSTTQAGGSFTGLSAGSYNIYIEDASGCSVTGTEIVSGNGGPTITGITIDNSLECFGDCDGELTVNVTGGIPPYTYAWEDGTGASVGGNSPTITGLCADNYTVTVTDAGGGTTTLWNEDFGVDAACTNQNQLATAFVSANGTWSQTIMAVEGGVPNQWFVSATEAGMGTGNCGDGCLGNVTLTNQTLHVGSLGVGLCPTGDCGAAYNAGANGETHKRIESPTINLTGQSGVTVSFDYMHFGELNTDAASLAYFDGAIWTNLVAPLPQTTCCGGPCGSLFAQGQWSPVRYSLALPASADNNPNVKIGFVWDNNANNSGADPSFAVDDIELTVLGGVGCPAVASVNLTEPAQLSFDNIATTSPTCNGDTDASISITASGGTGTIDYSNNNGVSFQASNSFTGLDNGSYDLVLEDDNGCQISQNVVINDPPLLSINSVSGSDPSCNGDNDGSITINATGGTGVIVYSINNGTSFQGANTFNGLTAGTYNIVVQDDNSCQASTTITLNNPAAVSIDNIATVDPLCNGDMNGSITITASGGTTPLNYSINNGATFQPSGSFTGLGAGGYTIVVEDANGCQASTSVTLTNPSALNISGVTVADPLCNGASSGSITINATGGTAPLNYSIDNGVTFQAGNNFSGLSSGSYDVVVEDANGCQVTTTSTLNDPPAVTIDNITSNDPTCNGDTDGNISIVASGGTGGLNYSIDNGVTFQAGGNFNGLGAGTYDVVVEDANGCQATTQIILTDPAVLSIDNITSTDPSCFATTDGSIIITASGGTGTLNYSIDNGVTFQASGSFSTLSDGTYMIVVEDANGCQVTSSVTLTEPAQLTYTATIVDENCGASDGEINLSASGGDGGPYNYSIDNGATTQSSGTFTGLIAGNYNIVITDGAGCSVTGTETITNIGGATIDNILSFDPNCNGGSDGTITITASGGTAPLSYSIDNNVSNQATGAFTGLGAGTYDIVVEDATGCLAVSQVILFDPPALTIDNTNLTSPSCNSATDGSIEITASGGTGSLSYSIDNGASFQVSNIFNGLGTGTYDIVVEDANGCQVSTQINLNATSAGPVVDDIPDVSACGQYTLPSITGSDLSGNESYYDAPNGGGTAYAAGNTINSSTTLYIYDAVGTCSSEESFNITIDVMPDNADAGIDFTICDTSNNEALSANTPAIGTGAWNDSGANIVVDDLADPNSTLSGLVPGNHVLVWEISNGSCPNTMDTVIVTVEECPEIELSIPNGFTPDGTDNINATWEIQGIDQYPDVTVQIFNKWGTEIFYSTGYASAWDGSYNGKPLPVGTYYYIINLNNGEEAYTGSVTIIK